MAKYVELKLDTEYTGSLTDKENFNIAEVPTEEIEIREMMLAWYQTGFVPATTAPCKENIARLKKLEKTLLTILNNATYQAAFIRVLSTLPSNECSVRLRQLLELAQGKHLTQ